MKEVIILGMGNSRVDCPFDAETWGVNNSYRQTIQQKGRLDKVFIAHKGQEYDAQGDPVFNWDDLNTLIDAGIEFITLFDIKELKKTTRYPYEEISKLFETEFFSDTIAYMIAYALYKNVDSIRLYGVDMKTEDEYLTERPGIEYFIGVAKTMGVKVWIHPDSRVCKTVTGKPYGF